ncbi:hypothetical protein P9139_13810 [Curtobacterium flaccumfaciens]|nr:hypothetical protein P9139_13810 [Curtobacterium flaccumfaciens]
MSTDLNEGHVEYFPLTEQNLESVPELAEALIVDGRLGTIREMAHEVRQGQRIFLFLVDF